MEKTNTEIPIQKRPPSKHTTTKPSIPTKPTHFCSINGPILFTAPHSATLYRGGKEYNTKVTIHGREKHTAILAIRYAAQTSGSFCVWNHTKVLSHKELDPNYMIDSKLSISPFHQALHALQAKNPSIPLMHIDIHGKVDRKKNFNLDLGLVSMDVHWGSSESKFISEFCSGLTKGFDKALKLCGQMNGYDARCENNPALHGYWGGGIYTMTEQAIRLGIPSFQLEIPTTMRYRLFVDRGFSDMFLEGIMEVYKNVVVPWWGSRTIGLKYDEIVSKRLEEIPSDLKKDDYKVLIESYEKYEESKKPAKEEF